jgi:predicted dinucleotide-binding enzyme
MKIGILGTGEVGRSLGTAFVKEGHEVKMGSRSAGNEKAKAWVASAGGQASEGSFADVARFADILVLCTLGVANESALRAAGLDQLSGKLIIDTTNPLDFSTGKPQLAVGHTDSGGEQVQRLVPNAKVVKAWNTVGNTLMYKPSFSSGTPDMPICGDDEGAKAQVAKILKEFGWDVLDLGGIESARYLEPMCMAWVVYGMRAGTWNHAWKLLRK